MLDHLEEVILVDEDDRKLSHGPKLGTHADGLLHRAFSVFVFNRQGQLLIQRRADCKYHSAGKWANSCCGHPRPDEDVQSAAERRLFEEVGLRLPLQFGFKARYTAYLDNDMIENEIPYMYFVCSDESPDGNPDEVQELSYIDLDDLDTEIAAAPERFSAWLVHYMDVHAKQIKLWRDRLIPA